MRILSLFIVTLLIIACNNSDKKKKEDTKDTVKQVTQVPPTRATPDTIFTGAGTEPFWLVYVVKDTKIVFHPADGPIIEVPYVVPATPDNLTTTYKSASGTTTMELTIIKKDCSDGMSEIMHPYEVNLLINTTKYSGCGKNK